MAEYVSFIGETIDSSKVMSRADYDKASSFMEEILGNPEARSLVRRYQDVDRTEGEKRLALKKLVDTGRMPTDEQFREVWDIVQRQGCKYVEPSEKTRAKITALSEAEALTPRIIDDIKQDSVRELSALKKRWYSVVYDWIPMFDAVRENRDLFMTDEDKQRAMAALDNEIGWDSARAKAREHYDSLKSPEERVAFARRHPDFFPEFQ